MSDLLDTLKRYHTMATTGSKSKRKMCQGVYEQFCWLAHDAIVKELEEADELKRRIAALEGT